jgi:hypothetical protein
MPKDQKAFLVLGAPRGHRDADHVDRRHRVRGRRPRVPARARRALAEGRHHVVILEMTGPSIRNEEALKRGDVTRGTTTPMLPNDPNDGWGDVVDVG